jgi:methionine aminopeptidase
VTVDGSLSAHFELTVAVTDYGPWILSEPYPYDGARRESHAG